MNKTYSRINWQNYPSEETPLNETNLNRIDLAVNTIDDRVITLDTTKFDSNLAGSLINGITFNKDTGIFTISFYSGSTQVIDTKLEKIAVNFDYDEQTQQLVILLDDGTRQYVDLSSLITEYEFLDSDTIAHEVTQDGKIKANVKLHSITDEMLESNFLSEINIQVANAEQYANNAHNSELNAQMHANNAMGYSDNVEEINNQLNQKLGIVNFNVNDDGYLIYTDSTVYNFIVDDNGNLNWEVIV